MRAAFMCESQCVCSGRSAWQSPAVERALHVYYGAIKEYLNRGSEFKDQTVAKEYSTRKTLGVSQLLHVLEDIMVEEAPQLRFDCFGFFTSYMLLLDEIRIHYYDRLTALIARGRKREEVYHLYELVHSLLCESAQPQTESRVVFDKPTPQQSKALASWLRM